MRKILKCLAKGFASALLVFLGLGAGRSVKALELQAPIRGAGADISDAYYALGLKETPKLLKRANILCTVTQAAYIGKVHFSDGDGSAVTGELYEAACREGLGYLVDQRTDNSPAALDCIAASGSGNLACMLPNNRRPAAGLARLIHADDGLVSGMAR